MTDRTTKALLFAIATGLWLNVMGDWVRPTPVQAQSASALELSTIELHLSSISGDTSSMRSSLRTIALNGLLR